MWYDAEMSKSRGHMNILVTPESVCLGAVVLCVCGFVCLWFCVFVALWLRVWYCKFVGVAFSICLGGEARVSLVSRMVFGFMFYNKFFLACMS